MRATLAIALGAVACLAACGRSDDLYSKRSQSAPLADSTVGPPAFVGRWATTAADCGQRPWTLSPAELVAPSGMRCNLGKLSPGSAGYGADVVCKGAGPERLGRITLTMSGQGASRGLTLAGGPFTMPVALTSCPTG
jgi:hypothetical protein